MKKNDKLARRPKALQAGGSTRVPRKIATRETLPVGWVRETDWYYSRKLDAIEITVVKVAGAWQPHMHNKQLARASGFTSRITAMRACERRARVILTKALKELDAAPKKKAAK